MNFAVSTITYRWLRLICGNSKLMCKCKQDDMPPSVEDIPPPVNSQLSGRYKQSYAFVTLKSRLGAILDQTLKQLNSDTEKVVAEHGGEARNELCMIKDLFSKLKREIQLNKPFVPFNSSGADIDKWNQFLVTQAKAENGEVRWYTTVWIYSECYMYRRLREAFELCRTLQGYDPFRQQKESALLNAIPAMMVLADWLVKEINAHEQNHGALQESHIHQEFTRLVHASVWGNKCDLGHTLGTQIEIVDDPLALVDKFRNFMLVDDSHRIWETLTHAKGKGPPVTVGIINDNAGYEFFTDLCLADFLCTFSLADSVCFHLKALPWFISDVMPYDMEWTIRTLGEPQRASPSLATLSTRWKGYLSTGRWTAKAEDYWTLPYTYRDMEAVDPELYQSLKEATLLIFKGDVNYRKLLAETNWEHTTSFPEAIDGFRPAPVVALRTVKCDLVCGLQPGQSETAKVKNVNWMLTGDYAVIQFAEKIQP